ncbi:hypothetical protein ITJ64_08200 [Herbiconiux sp. VKM Ac-1786]|uniref:MmyB family transcriptional regulator n=1 Tax=Herbiconiux sp. VKM Ac-1786 TaxID=2783824 RepID=UPI00188D8DFB|nr:hypothetical protein [Herbiconiux sp. VKM Ac-1786]MBF4572496.1 hypothetical protein [Herbiconiux sp. VKM Ac-1786]
MRDEGSPGVVPAEALQMINAWTAVPAFIRDRYLNVIASNDLAKEISPIFNEGVNLVRVVFCAGQLPAGVQTVPQQLADKLKEALALYEWDAEFEELVEELSAASPEFVQAWAGASDTVEPLPFSVHHSQVGPLSLTYQAMTMPGQFDLSLAVLRGTDDDSRAALQRLAELTGPDQS